MNEQPQPLVETDVPAPDVRAAQEAAAWPPAPSIDNQWPVMTARPRRPNLSSGLWLGGALLWAYLVMGELVVSAEFPEGLAFLVVLSTLAINWRGVHKRRLDERASKLQALIPALLGIALYILVLMFATALLGSSNRSSISALTVMLWFFAALAYGIGRFQMRTAHSKQTARERALSVVLWIVSGIATLIALLSALKHV